MNRSRRRRKAKVLIPTTSMGDIAFLLIIFFILCTTKKAGFTVKPPESAGLEDLPKSSIYAAIDEEGRLWLDGAEVGAVSEIEAGVAERIEKIERLDPNAPVDKRTVIFECDKSIKKEVFEPVLEAIAKAGGIIGAVGTEKRAKAR